MDRKLLSCKLELFALLKAKKVSWQGRPGQLNFAVRFVAQERVRQLEKNSLQGSVEKLAFSPVTFDTLGQLRPTQHLAVMEMFCISILQQRNH